MFLVADIMPMLVAETCSGRSVREALHTSVREVVDNRGKVAMPQRTAAIDRHHSNFMVNLRGQRSRFVYGSVSAATEGARKYRLSTLWCGCG